MQKFRLFCPPSCPVGLNVIQIRVLQPGSLLFLFVFSRGVCGSSVIGLKPPQFYDGHVFCHIYIFAGERHVRYYHFLLLLWTRQLSIEERRNSSIIVGRYSSSSTVQQLS